MNMDLSETVDIAALDATLPALVKAGKIPAILEGPLRLAIDAVAKVEGANAVNLHVSVQINPVRVG